MAHLIQGVFFQQNQWLDLAERPRFGTCVVINKGVCRFVYAGVIWRDNAKALGPLVGSITDHFGESELSNVSVTEQGIEFVKRYLKRRDTIRYVFSKKDGNTWAGEWSGDAVGSGISRCVVTEVPDEFFSPEALMKLLGASEIHKWPPLQDWM